MFISMLACGISGHCFGKSRRIKEDEFERQRKATNRSVFKNQLLEGEKPVQE